MRLRCKLFHIPALRYKQKVVISSHLITCAQHASEVGHIFRQCYIFSGECNIFSVAEITFLTADTILITSPGSQNGPIVKNIFSTTKKCNISHQMCKIYQKGYI